MSDEDLKNKVKKFPQLPGVYLMKSENGQIIYVGKAKNLRSRVGSYFTKSADSRYQIQFLLKRVCEIDILLCENEKEALLLEDTLIKKHKPKYNIDLKDGRSYVSFKINIKHPFPRLTVTRRIKKDGSLYYGPYTRADACRETLEYMIKSFRIRSCSDHEMSHRSRPCLEYQIKRCTAPCVGYVSQQEYAKQLEPVKLFLEGKNKELVKSLKASMERASQNQKYEEAAHFRDVLFNMESVLEKQRVVKHGGEHQDLIVLYREKRKAIVAVLNIRDGKLVDSRSYQVESPDTDDVLLEHFLSRYYLATSFIPDEILLSTVPDGLDGLMDYLSGIKSKKVHLRTPKKGEKKDLIEFALQFARAEFSKWVSREFEMNDVLQRLKTKLNLQNFPSRIECFDISNISGEFATASCVTFLEGKPSKRDYRHYKIKHQQGPNDYAMMHEVLSRRLQKKPYPDLLIVDGGKGHLNIALKVLDELKISDISAIGMAKGTGPGARAKGQWKEKKEDVVFIPARSNPLKLKPRDAEMMLLQNIRDEAHRFALKYHKKLREDVKGVLDDIEGIGPQKKKAIYAAFGDLEKMKRARLEDWIKVKGIHEDLAIKIMKHIT